LLNGLLLVLQGNTHCYDSQWQLEKLLIILSR